MATEPYRIAFLVYETDPFVRADIEETLSLSFPEHPVRVLETLSDLTKVQMAEMEKSVAVVSADTETLASLSRSVKDMTCQLGLVIISEAQIAMKDVELACKYVSRPFKSDAIIDAVRDVLSSLQRTLP